MPKKETILQKILKYAVIALIFIGIPALIGFFAQPQYGVFDGITVFAGKYSIFLALVLFAMAYVLRVVLKKTRPELIKGAAAFILAGLVCFTLLKLFSGALALHALVYLYLTGWAMFLSYYFFEDIPPVLEKIRSISKMITGTTAVVLKWVWRAFLFLAAPFLIVAISRNAWQVSSFFNENITALGLVFFFVPAAWRKFVKKEKFSIKE